MKIEFEFSKTMKHSSIADPQLQVDQIERKTEAKFNKPLFFQKSTILRRQNDHRLSSTKLEKNWS